MGLCSDMLDSVSTKDSTSQNLYKVTGFLVFATVSSTSVFLLVMMIVAAFDTSWAMNFLQEPLSVILGKTASGEYCMSVMRILVIFWAFPGLYKLFKVFGF